MNDMPTVCNEKVRVAAKPHKCCECAGLIFPRERYYYFSGIWSGKAADYKRCGDCQRIIYAVEKELRARGIPCDELIPFGGLPEELDNSDDVERKKEFEKIKRKRNPPTP